MLRIEIETRHSQVTLRCVGRLVLGLEAETLRCMVTTRPEPVVHVDLSGIRAIDAAGLGLLLKLRGEAREKGKALTVVKPSRCVSRLLTLLNLQQALEVAGAGGMDEPSLPDRRKVMSA